MKFVVIFTLLLAGVSALPKDELVINSGQERLVTGNIERAVEDLSRIIQEAGLDPLHIDLYKAERVTLIASGSVRVEDLLFTGLSKFLFDNLSFTVTTSRLRMNIFMPSIALRLRSAGIELEVFGSKLTAELGGSLEILKPRIDADIRFNIGIISGISVRSATVQFDLGGIKSDMNLRVQDRDLSEGVNEWLGETIPDFLDDNRNEINDWLTDITVILLDRLL